MLSKNGIVLFLVLIVSSVVLDIPATDPGQHRPEGKSSSGPSIHSHLQSTRSFPVLTASFLPSSPPITPLPELCHHVETHGSPSIDCSHRHSGTLPGTSTLDYLASTHFVHPFESSKKPDDSNLLRPQSADGSILKPPPRTLAV